MNNTPKVTAINWLDIMSWWTRNGDGHINTKLLDRIIKIKSNKEFVEPPKKKFFTGRTVLPPVEVKEEILELCQEEFI